MSSIKSENCGNIRLEFRLRSRIEFIISWIAFDWNRLDVYWLFWQTPLSSLLGKNMCQVWKIKLHCPLTTLQKWRKFRKDHFQQYHHEKCSNLIQIKFTRKFTHKLHFSICYWVHSLPVSLLEKCMSTSSLKYQSETSADKVITTW